MFPSIRVFSNESAICISWPKYWVEPLFLKHYMNSHHFQGGHTPTAEQFKTWYCPLIEKLLLDYPIAEDRVRYFQHFKGDKYKLIASAFDSETQEP